MSWRNPDARHRDWDLDTYGGAIVAALDAVRAISGAGKANLLALCSGGIATSMVAAHLSVAGRPGELASLCLGVAVLDQEQAGTAGAVIDEATAAAATAASATRGYLDGRALAEVFAWLRPDDLIWNYWVNNYLQGRPPPAFDILSGTPTPPGCLPRCTATSSSWPGQRADGAGPGDHAGLAGRPVQGRRGRLRHRRRGRPPVPVAVVLPDDANARRAGQVRAVHQRAHSVHGQPAGQPEGRLPDRAGPFSQPGRPARIPRRGDDRAGQL